MIKAEADLPDNGNSVNAVKDYAIDYDRAHHLTIPWITQTITRKRVLTLFFCALD